MVTICHLPCVILVLFFLSLTACIYNWPPQFQWPNQSCYYLALLDGCILYPLLEEFFLSIRYCLRDFLQVVRLDFRGTLVTKMAEERGLYFLLIQILAQTHCYCIYRDKQNYLSFHFPNPYIHSHSQNNTMNLLLTNMKCHKFLSVL